MKKTISFLVTLLLLNFALINTAQSATLLDVYRMALQNNPQWKTFALEKDQADLQSEIASAALKPQIGLAGSIGYTWLDSNSAQLPNLTNDQFLDLNQCLSNNNDYNFCLGQVSTTNCADEPACLIAENGASQQIQQTQLGLQLSQILYAPSTWYQAQQGQQQQQQAKYIKSQQEQAFIFTLIESYLTALGQREESEIADKALQVHNQQVRWLEKSFENGLTTADNVLYARALQNLQQTQFEQSQRQSNVAFATLEAITQQTIESLSNIDRNIPMPPPNPASPEAWIELAQKKSPTLKRMQIALEMAETETKKRRGLRKPEIKLVAGIGTNTASTNNALSDSSQTTSTNINLELSMPLYTGGALSKREQESLSIANQLQLNHQVAQAQLDRDIREYFSIAEGSLRHIQLLESAIESLELQVKNLEKAFENGVKDASTLLDARQKLFETEQQRQIARFNYIKASIKLKQLAGVLNKQDILVIASWSDEIEPNQNRRSLFDQSKPWLAY
ncbi:MAG: TolC family protein [Pseudomonadota bacterium]|nr:TolC family protein [Pseudomonadota bacterium]